MDTLDWCWVGLSTALLMSVVGIGYQNVVLVEEVDILTESIDRRPLPPETDLITFDDGRIRMQCYPASLDSSK